MQVYEELEKSEKSKLFHTFFFPVTFVVVLWLIMLSEIAFNINLSTFGVYPRAAKGLIGVFTAPLIHANFEHLFSNSIPLLVLGSGLFYYYNSKAYKIFFMILLATGLWVWVAARPSYHIGASGVVYGLATFMFVSGAIKKNISLAAFSLVVVFLYGNIIWGVLPVLPHVSWESHLLGAIAGIFMAVYYKNEGPQRTTYQFELEPEVDNEMENAYQNPEEFEASETEEQELKNEAENNSIISPQYTYTFVPKKEE